MAQQQLSLLPSILDRLLDPDSLGTVARPGYTVEQMAHAVQGDLERLLNTRSNDIDALKPYRRLAEVLGYGLPDMAALGRLGDKDIDRICRVLEEKILRYEPRLKDVRVTQKGASAADPLKIQLHLQAVLAVDPAPEVVFDTTLDLGSGHFVHDGAQ